MTTGRSLISAILAVGLLTVAVWYGAANVQKRKPKPTDAEKVEALVHRQPGRKSAGEPKTADPKNSGRLILTITDADTKSPVFCRVNVIGSDGHYYEPAKNPLKPWSLHRLGNRKGKGPIRYYGWFFYCNGKCEIAVPPGKTRVEVWKGFEYSPKSIAVNVRKAGRTTASIAINRTVDMAKLGWYSGDTHIHLHRRNAEDDARALDLAAAADIRYAHILAMNNPRFYKPNMGDQIWHQKSGLGPKSAKFRVTGGGRYGIMSGQEYRCGTFGHICLLGHNRLVQADGQKTNPNNWPVFGLVADETRSQGGVSFHAHGGYEKEIYADFAQRATTGVELLQFAVYRGIALEGWHHILNAGFEFPAVGASDYPYCRALGDCRTYVRASSTPSFADWLKGAARGESFFTTGPLLTMTVNGKPLGSRFDLPKGKQTLTVKVWMRSPVADVDTVMVIANGKIVKREQLKNTRHSRWFDWKFELPIKQSTVLTARAFAKNSESSREDVEAHTNPIYVRLGGKPTRSPASIKWLIKKLDGRIAYHAKRKFKEKARVLAYFRKSRAVLTRLLKNP